MLFFRFSVVLLRLAVRLRAVARWSWLFLPACLFLPAGLAAVSVVAAAVPAALSVLALALALLALGLRALSCLFVCRGLCPSFGVPSRRAAWACCFRVGGGSFSGACAAWAGGAAGGLPAWRLVSPAGLAAARAFSGCAVLAVRPAAVSRLSGRVLAVWVLAGGSFPHSSQTYIGNNAASLSARRKNPTTPLLTKPP